MILCGKFPTVFLAGLAQTISKDPEGALNFFIFLIFSAIGSAVIALIVTGIVKLIFEFDKEKATMTFWITGLTLLGISLIGYWIS